MSENRIEVQWTENKYVKQRMGVACEDPEAAHRVYVRVCGMLQALLDEERKQGEKRGAAR